MTARAEKASKAKVIQPKESFTISTMLGAIFRRVGCSEGEMSSYKNDLLKKQGDYYHLDMLLHGGTFEES